jgi:hypothetical protein
VNRLWRSHRRRNHHWRSFNCRSRHGFRRWNEYRRRTGRCWWWLWSKDRRGRSHGHRLGRSEARSSWSEGIRRRDRWRGNRNIRSHRKWRARFRRQNPCHGCRKNIIPPLGQLRLTETHFLSRCRKWGLLVRHDRKWTRGWRISCRRKWAPCGRNGGEAFLRLEDTAAGVHGDKVLGCGWEESQMIIQMRENV